MIRAPFDDHDWHTGMALPRARRRRTGISLLEVLISIAVLAIGLLGVLALIPVASQQAEEGARNDAVGIAGRRAFRELNVRGYNAAAMWDLAWRTNTTIYADVFLDDTRRLQRNPTTAFCLDPYGYFLYPGPVGLQLVDPTLYTFPSDEPLANSVFLPRHTVKQTPGPSGLRLSAAQIEEIFTFQEDLQFELPERSTDVTQQQTLSLTDANGNPIAAKRYAKGAFSWFATFVPANYAANGYIVSVAVVRERRAFGEKTVNATINSFGGSGEVILAEAVPELKPGHWFMLMASPQPGGRMGTAATPAQYEWYRVVATDGTRLTVSGEDWHAPPSLPTIAVIVPGTVAVYSKSLPISEAR